MVQKELRTQREELEWIPWTCEMPNIAHLEASLHPKTIPTRRHIVAWFGAEILKRKSGGQRPMQWAGCVSTV